MITDFHDDEARILAIPRKWENCRKLWKHQAKEEDGATATLGALDSPHLCHPWTGKYLLLHCIFQLFSILVNIFSTEYLQATLGLVNFFCYLIFSIYLANMVNIFSTTDSPHLCHPWTGEYFNNVAFW